MQKRREWLVGVTLGFAGALLLIAIVAILGCGEEGSNVLEPLKQEKVSSVGEGKLPEEVAAAPGAPNTGVPFVKEVGYYRDWKRTKPVTDPVKPGDTIHIKIVFSEGMKLVVADDKTARPIFYYKTGEALTRFHIAPFGAKGGHFVSGDCKPVGSQAVYFGKYTVQESDSTFSIAVGKLSTDRQGNAMAAFYRHKEQLKVAVTPEEVTVAPDTGVPFVKEIGYYRDASLTEPLIDSVEIGTTVYTKVVYSEEIPIVIADTPEARPSIFFTVGLKDLQYRMKPRHMRNKDLLSGDAKPHGNINNSFICKYIVQVEDFDKAFFVYVEGELLSGNPLHIVSPPRLSDEHNITKPKNSQDFIGLICTPPREIRFSNDRITTRIREEPWPVFNATVTIMSGPRHGESVSTDKNGQYLFPRFEGNEGHLRVEKEQFEPKEVIVHRNRPTILTNGDAPNFYNDPQKVPGTILIGQAWPDKVRPILQQTVVVYDLLYVEVALPPDYGGFYNSGIVAINKNRDYKLHGISDPANTVAHEIAHARQHALFSIDGSRGNMSEWEATPEARAFVEARRKDWAKHGKADYDHIPAYSRDILENAAETCAYYWSIGRWKKNTSYKKLEIDAPNRFKWAEKWLGK